MHIKGYNHCTIGTDSMNYVNDEINYKKKQLKLLDFNLKLKEMTIFYVRYWQFKTW